MRHAAQANVAVCCGGQHDIMRLDARKLFEDSARRVAETGALLPHLEAFPQHESEKADEDMSLDAILALVPDRTYIELIFLDPECGFSLRELDVSLPELLIQSVMFERRR